MLVGHAHRRACRVSDSLRIARAAAGVFVFPGELPSVGGAVPCGARVADPLLPQDDVAPRGHRRRMAAGGVRRVAVDAQLRVAWGRCRWRGQWTGQNVVPRARLEDVGLLGVPIAISPQATRAASELVGTRRAACVPDEFLVNQDRAHAPVRAVWCEARFCILERPGEKGVPVEVGPARPALAGGLCRADSDHRVTCANAGSQIRRGEHIPQAHGAHVGQQFLADERGGAAVDGVGVQHAGGHEQTHVLTDPSRKMPSAINTSITVSP